jgi:hypothetical protein
MMTMKIRFYTKKNSDSETVKKANEVFRQKEMQEFTSHRYGGEWIDGINFKEDEHGLYVDTDSFLDGVPDRVRGLPIRVVTLYDEVSHEVRVGQFPQLGIYKLGNATAIVDTYIARRAAGKDLMDGTIWESFLTWRIRIKGKTLASVEALYRRFRSGQLEPTEAWTDRQKATEDEAAAVVPRD